MKRSLNPKWELLLAVLIFVIPCLAVALFYVWLELAFGWQPDLSSFLTQALFKFCGPGVVAFLIIGVLLCLFLWYKKGTDAALPLIALPLVFCSGALVHYLYLTTKSFWSQIFAEIIRFISSL